MQRILALVAVLVLLLGVHIAEARPDEQPQVAAAGVSASASTAPPRATPPARAAATPARSTARPTPTSSARSSASATPTLTATPTVTAPPPVTTSPSTTPPVTTPPVTTSPSATPAPQTPTPAPSAPSPFAQVDAAMLAVLSDGGFAGGTLAVSRNGKLVYASGFGLATKDGVQVAARPDTKFRQASLSKVVTLSQLRRLIAAGKLSWTTTVFPYLGVNVVDDRMNQITVRHLVDHTSGFAKDYTWEARAAANALAIASPPEDDDMIRYVATQSLATQPGTTRAYQNFNFALLMRVMERADGRTWITQVRDLASIAGIGTTDWRIAYNLDRAADEAAYYDAAIVPSVFDAYPGMRPWTYGGVYYDANAAAIGLVTNEIDMVRYGIAVAQGRLPRAEDNPIPTSPGYSYTYTFEGSLPGTLTFVSYTWDGANLVVWAVAFNGRTGGAFDANVASRLDGAIRAVADWPSVDLFPLYP